MRRVLSSVTRVGSLCTRQVARWRQSRLSSFGYLAASFKNSVIMALSIGTICGTSFKTNRQTCKPNFNLWAFLNVWTISWMVSTEVMRGSFWEAA